jgi:hypothetical protein
VTAAGVTAAYEAARVFAARIMSCVADVALTVAGFIPLEVLEGLSAVIGEGAVVAVTGVIAVIHVPVEAVRAVEPGTGAEEDAADEPVGPIVAVGRAVIGCVVVVAIGADRRSADADGDLGWGSGGEAAEQGSGSSGESKRFEDRHECISRYQ